MSPCLKTPNCLFFFSATAHSNNLESESCAHTSKTLRSCSLKYSIYKYATQNDNRNPFLINLLVRTSNIHPENIGQKRLSSDSKTTDFGREMGRIGSGSVWERNWFWIWQENKHKHTEPVNHVMLDRETGWGWEKPIRRSRNRNGLWLGDMNQIWLGQKYGRKSRQQQRDWNTGGRFWCFGRRWTSQASQPRVDTHSLNHASYFTHKVKLLEAHFCNLFRLAQWSDCTS